MDSNTTRGLVNQILYDIDFVPDLNDDAAVEARADSLIAQRNFLHPVDEYAEAIALTLRAGRLAPQTVEMSERYSETELLHFLTRLAKRLDEKRPWAATRS